MAIRRPQQYCPRCDKPLKALHRDMGKDFVGDTFIKWIPCDCVQTVQLSNGETLPKGEPLLCHNCGKHKRLPKDSIVELCWCGHEEPPKGEDEQDADLIEDAVSAYYHEATRKLAGHDLGDLERANWENVQKKCKAYLIKIQNT